MNWTAKSSVLSILILTLSMTFPNAHSSDASFGSLKYINDEVIFLGDIVTINAGWCWPSKKPTQSLAKKRLEIYKSGRWVSVGKVIFYKSEICQKKTPYLQQFQWEVDELGVMDPDQVSGKLRMRNSAVKPTIYSKVIVFESEESYQTKLKKDEEEAEKATAERIGGYMAAFNCVVQGGEWNSQGNYCVYPKG